MWRIAAKLLWAFEFTEPIDPDTGMVKPLDPYAYNPGILQAPLRFDVKIRPRSAGMSKSFGRKWMLHLTS